ncbi:MAG: hypothetical protein QW350_01550 [Candidatus Aenigmatarchaeota archaeon]
MEMKFVIAIILGIILLGIILYIISLQSGILDNLIEWLNGLI